MVWVTDNASDYVLDRFSTQLPQLDAVVAPSAGPGRWFQVDPFMLTAANFDAFGRLRIGSPETIFEAKSVYHDDPIRFVTDTASGGAVAYQASRSSYALTVTSTVGSKATRQTKRYLNYQPGKGQLIFATFVMTNGEEAGVVKRVGYFDDDNGVYFASTGSGLVIVQRSDVSGAPVDTVIAQADWNLDTLDGTGPSGLTLDVSKSQIFLADFQWLGAGRVRVGFSVDGQIVYAHEFLNANYVASVYMQTPNLPVRWEAETTGASSGGALEAICCTVLAEGGMAADGVLLGADMGTASRNVTTVAEPLISIRLKATANRATVFPKLAEIITVGNANSRWFIQLNPTISGGAAASWVSVPNSYVEYDVTRDGTLNQDGILLASGYLSKTAAIALAQGLQSLVLASDYAGTPDELVVGVQTLSTNDNFLASLQWLEQ